MVNISSLLPPVNTHRMKSKNHRGDIAVAGSEADKHAPHPVVEQQQEKRKGRDRRQRDVKPLVDMRSGRDRRKDPDKPVIDLKV